ncbi:hypothetical protein M0802_009547 [Mischocyttarus mexicanus]|nr:hypothetical protein M0802_009547 [Mischocyttarus mexicanus]
MVERVEKRRNGRKEREGLNPGSCFLSSLSRENDALLVSVLWWLMVVVDGVGGGGCGGGTAAAAVAIGKAEESSNRVPSRFILFAVRKV